jgi:hypothetical protein
MFRRLLIGYLQLIKSGNSVTQLYVGTHIRLNVTVCAQHSVYVGTHIRLNVTVCAQHSVYVGTHIR